MGVDTQFEEPLAELRRRIAELQQIPPTAAIQSQIDGLQRDLEQASRDAADAWVAECTERAARTLMPSANSWYMGANIPGKKNAVMFYMAGGGAYRQQLAAVADAGYSGFELGTGALAGRS